MNDDNVFGDGDDETMRVQIFPTLIGSSDDDDDDADQQAGAADHPQPDHHDCVSFR